MKKLLLLVAMMTMCGCSWYKNEDTISDGKRTVTKKAIAYGVGGASIRAPIFSESSLGTDTTSVGSTTYTESENTGIYALYYFGALCIIAGVVGAIWLKRYYIGAALVGAGVALIALAHYPWIMLIAAGLGLAGAVYWVWDSYFKVRLKKKEVALKQTVKGVDRAIAKLQIGRAHV